MRASHILREIGEGLKEQRENGDARPSLFWNSLILNSSFVEDQALSGIPRMSSKRLPHSPLAAGRGWRWIYCYCEGRERVRESAGQEVAACCGEGSNCCSSRGCDRFLLVWQSKVGLYSSHHGGARFESSRTWEGRGQKLEIVLHRVDALATRQIQALPGREKDFRRLFVVENQQTRVKSKVKAVTWISLRLLAARVN